MLEPKGPLARLHRFDIRVQKRIVRVIRGESRVVIVEEFPRACGILDFVQRRWGHTTIGPQSGPVQGLETEDVGFRLFSAEQAPRQIELHAVEEVAETPVEFRLAIQIVGKSETR